MLQRLVRSIVRTEPRPHLIDDVPWLWSLSVTAGRSRPGKRLLDAVLKRRIDRERVGERAVRRARLLDLDRAVAFEDRRFDFADLARAQNLVVVGAAQDARARLLDAGRDTANRSYAASPVRGTISASSLGSGADAQGG